jgi:2-oxoglutarate ferredoxin oxidoreductase subunit gamma
MSGVIQIRFCGFGGQGIVLAGLLLGQAGVIEGRYVAGSSSYGAQARGSVCKSEIVFSENPIDFPHLITADFLVAMSQEAYDLYWRDVKEASGLILYDNGLVNPKKDLKGKQLGVPATKLAISRLKNKQMANLTLIGALIQITKIVSSKAVQKAIRHHISERFRTSNLKAFRMGMELGRRVHG